MYARLTAHDKDAKIERELEGDVTEELVLEFVRQIFRDHQIVMVGPGGASLKGVALISIDFRRPER